eukprot:gene10472-12383_t
MGVRKHAGCAGPCEEYALNPDGRFEGALGSVESMLEALDTGHAGLSRRDQREWQSLLQGVQKPSDPKSLADLAHAGDPGAAFMMGMFTGQRLSFHVEPGSSGSDDVTEDYVEGYTFGLPALKRTFNVKSTQQEAAEWYRVAAAGGCLPAMLLLADYLAEGKGVRQDSRTAYDYWYMASNQGVASARRQLAERSLLAKELRATYMSINNFVQQGRIQPGQAMRPGGPNLANLLLSACDGWLHSDAGGLAATSCLREDLQALSECRRRYRLSLSFTYGRRGTMGKATELANQGASGIRDVQNSQFLVGRGSLEDNGRDAAEDARIAAAVEAATSPEKLLEWRLAMAEAPPWEVVCTHSGNEGVDVMAGCSMCEAAAAERLKAVAARTFACSDHEPIASAGHVALYMDFTRGQVISETFKDYSRADVDAVLRALASSDDGRKLANAWFVAMDPNLFWPVVAYYGNVQRAFAQIRSPVWPAPRFHSVNSRQGVSAVASSPPSLDAAASNPFTSEVIGKYMRRCGNEKCYALKLKLQKCGGCRVRGYCGLACQKADWKQHKAECKKQGCKSASQGM